MGSDDDSNMGLDGIDDEEGSEGEDDDDDGSEVEDDEKANDELNHPGNDEGATAPPPQVNRNGGDKGTTVSPPKVAAVEQPETLTSRRKKKRKKQVDLENHRSRTALSLEEQFINDTMCFIIPDWKDQSTDSLVLTTNTELGKWFHQHVQDVTCNYCYLQLHGLHKDTPINITSDFGLDLWMSRDDFVFAAQSLRPLATSVEKSTNGALDYIQYMLCSPVQLIAFLIEDKIKRAFPNKGHLSRVVFVGFTTLKRVLTNRRFVISKFFGDNFPVVVMSNVGPTSYCIDQGFKAYPTNCFSDYLNQWANHDLTGVNQVKVLPNMCLVSLLEDKIKVCSALRDHVLPFTTFGTYQGDPRSNEEIWRKIMDSLVGNGWTSDDIKKHGLLFRPARGRNMHLLIRMRLDRNKRPIANFVSSGSVVNFKTSFASPDVTWFIVQPYVKDARANEVQLYGYISPGKAKKPMTFTSGWSARATDWGKSQKEVSRIWGDCFTKDEKKSMHDIGSKVTSALKNYFPNKPWSSLNYSMLRICCFYCEEKEQVLVSDVDVAFLTDCFSGKAEDLSPHLHLVSESIAKSYELMCFNKTRLDISKKPTKQQIRAVKASLRAQNQMEQKTNSA